jgi:hypothetical protein
MRLMIFLGWLLVAAIPRFSAFQKFQAPRSEAFELGGDKLGEDLKAFVANHPKAQCTDAGKPRVNCYQWADVSILGMTAHPDPGCSLKNASSVHCLQGLSATFLDQRLKLLTYAMAGSDKTEATSLLKKQLGTPTIDTSEATIWTNGNTTASAVVAKGAESGFAENLVTFEISERN